MRRVGSRVPRARGKAASLAHGRRTQDGQRRGFSRGRVRRLCTAREYASAESLAGSFGLSPVCRTVHPTESPSEPVGVCVPSRKTSGTVRGGDRRARKQRQPATDGTSADVTSAQGRRLCQVGDPGCGGIESRRGCGLNDVRLARGTPPTEVGSAHGADGRGEE